LLPPTAQPKK